MELTDDDIIAFAHGRATKEQIERIAEDLERPDSLTRKYLDEFSARVTGFLDNIAWGRLLDARDDAQDRNKHEH